MVSARRNENIIVSPCGLQMVPLKGRHRALSLSVYQHLCPLTPSVVKNYLSLISFLKIKDKIDSGFLKYSAHYRSIIGLTAFGSIYSLSGFFQSFILSINKCTKQANDFALLDDSMQTRPPCLYFSLQ